MVNVVATCLSAAQADPDTLLLARIKQRMANNLDHLPNYTCTQTIERFVRRAGSRRSQLLDTMRLEVALVGGKEMYAWPGAGRFEDREIKEFAPHGGAIGSGNFGMHARAVFLGEAPVFKFAGREARDGRSLVRFDYSVAQSRSGFEVHTGGAGAIVGYHGSFWADEQTRDLVRLEVIADDIPPSVGVKAASDIMNYSVMRIGDADFLLPTESEMIMTDMLGNENRNRTRFAGCRRYAGESVISFGEPGTASPAAPPREPRAIELPAGLPLDIALTSTIDSSQSAVGDRVTAALERDARWKGQLVAPKGALLSGRLALLERRAAMFGRSQGSYFIVGIRFDTLEFDSGRAEFFGTLEEIGPIAGPRMFGATARPTVIGRGWGPAPAAGDAQTGVGFFLVRGDTIKLGRGLRMSWKVEKQTQR